MDIRVINKNNEIINVTNLSIMAQGKWMVGMNDRGETVRIEEYENKEGAQDALERMSLAVEIAVEKDKENMLVRT